MKEVTDTVAEQVPSPGTSGHPARLPALAFIAVSAVFHYLSPAFAVTRFARLDVSGVTWLRISAAVVFAAGRHPWLLPRRLTAGQRRVLLALGAVLAVKNTTSTWPSCDCRWPRLAQSSSPPSSSWPWPGSEA